MNFKQYSIVTCDVVMLGYVHFFPTPTAQYQIAGRQSRTSPYFSQNKNKALRVNNSFVTAGGVHFLFLIH